MTEHKLALITGGAGGLGQAVADGLLTAGCDVVITDRNIEAGTAFCRALSQRFPQASIVFMPMDLADLGHIESFVQDFSRRFDRLDILINNAGLFPPFQRNQTRQGCELGFGVGFYGHFALTAGLLPMLLSARSSRVVCVSSIAHSSGRIDCKDPMLQRDYDAHRAYSACKLACLWFALELERRARMHNCNLSAVAAHPGIARTQIGQYTHNPARSLRQRAISWAMNFAMAAFGQSAQQAALPILHAALSDDVQGGQFIGPKGFGQFKGVPTVVRPNAAALARCENEGIWRMAEHFTGKNFNWSGFRSS